MLSSTIGFLLAAGQVVSTSTLATSTVTATSTSMQHVDTDADENPPILDVDSLFDVEIHAFVSQGAFIGTGNNYLGQSKRGSFELTDAGINFTKRVTDELRLGLQLFARDLGPVGNYNAKLDWFYLDYRWSDWLGFRAGRVKVPFGLYNEISDADSARLPILLPQSVYPPNNRDFLLAQTGFELYGYGRLGRAGELDYRLYFGTVFIEPTDPDPSQPYEAFTFDWPYIAGGRILWSTPISGLRVGGSIQGLELDADLFYKAATIDALKMSGKLPADFANPVHIRIPAILTVGSVEYSKGELLFAAEYSRWFVGSESDYPDAFPSTDTQSERFYGMLAYRFSRLFEGGVYYSVLFPNIDKRETRANSLQDWAATARFDINSFWLVKLEAHYYRGTAGLSSALNDGKKPSELELDWALFLARTTLYF